MYIYYIHFLKYPKKNLNEIFFKYILQTKKLFLQKNILKNCYIFFCMISLSLVLNLIFRFNFWNIIFKKLTKL